MKFVGRNSSAALATSRKVNLPTRIYVAKTEPIHSMISLIARQPLNWYRQNSGTIHFWSEARKIGSPPRQRGEYAEAEPPTSLRSTPG